jgi:hypothetical protein
MREEINIFATTNTATSAFMNPTITIYLYFSFCDGEGKTQASDHETSSDITTDAQTETFK